MIRTPWGPLRVFSVHLAHVGSEERLEQLEFLLALNRRAPLAGGPWSGQDDEPERNWSNSEQEPECPRAAILMGDFNSEPDSAEYRLITGHAPYHPGAVYVDGFVDSARAVGLDPASFTTHTGKGAAGQVRHRRLDYCFVSAILEKKVQRMWVDEGQTASDHKPVWTQINLESPQGTGEV
jgi:endonuclease/exonuclease/phosphatase family metal-dependent hydrolase